MNISYKNTIEDYIVFNKFHHKSTSKLRLKKLLIFYLLPLFWIILALFNYIFQKHISDMIFWLSFAILWMVLYPIYYNYRFKKNVQKFYTNNENKGMLGEHNLNITPEYILEKNEFEESKILWKGVNKIMANDDYIYIYLSSIQAFVIPKRSFSSEIEWNNFFESIQNYKRKNAG